MPEQKDNRAVAVIGIGNLLMTDEGLGVHAVEMLTEQEPESDVRLIDGGTNPWAALSAAEQCRSLLLLDAVQGGKPPGEFHRLGLEQVDNSSTLMSMHGVTLFHLLHYEEALGNGFEQVKVLGMEPQVVDYGIGLSELCRERLPAFVEMVRSEISQMQNRFSEDQGGT